jgi:cytochrome P450
MRTTVTRLPHTYPCITAKTYARARQALEYTHAVVTETLRLYPAVPKEIKWVEKDDVLPDGTRVFAHTWVCFSAYAMGRFPQLWEDPLRCARSPLSL